MRAWWSEVAERLRTGFWFLPLSMQVLAGLLATLCLQLDDRYDGTLGGLLETGGPSGAQTLLSTVAATMATVGATAFSITIVAMQLASTQFGPRMLTNFVRDRVNQFALGTFLAVFVFALVVLRRTGSDPETLPRISVAVTGVLAAGAVVTLIVFVHHIATTIQAMNLVQIIARDIDAQLERLFPDPAEAEDVDEAGGEHAVPEPDGPGHPVRVGSSGYLRLVDLDAVARLAAERDLLVRLETRPGKFLVDHSPVLRIWRADGTALGPDGLDDELHGRFADAVVTGPRRTYRQDIEFPMKQLVEVAVRALSPSVNDPITANACIDHLSAALCRIGARRLPPRVLLGPQGRPRIIVGDPLTFERLVGVAYDQIRQSAEAHVVVHVHLLEALTHVAGACRGTAECLDPLLRQGDLVLERAEQVVPQSADLEVVRERHRWLVGAVDAARERDTGHRLSHPRG